MFVDPELGYQVEMRQIPLVGVSADLRAGGGPRIEVMVGREGFDHTTHSVFDPKVVRVEQDDQGKPEVLEIESSGGRKTLVILTPADFGEPGEMVEALSPAGQAAPRQHVLYCLTRESCDHQSGPTAGRGALSLAVARSGRTRSEVVRDALRRQLALQRFDDLREMVLPFAERRDLLTDEDVFSAVS